MVPVPHTTCVFELSLELRGQVAPHRVGSAPSGLGKNRQVERKEAAPPQSPRLEAPVSQVALLRSFSQACVLGQHLTSSGVIPIHSPACCLQCTPRARCWGTQCRLRHPGHQHPASGAPSWPMGVSTGVTGLVCCLSLRAVWGEVGTPQEAPGEEDVSVAPVKAAPCLLLQGPVRSQLVSGRMGRPWAGELLTVGGCACAPVQPGRHRRAP